MLREMQGRPSDIIHGTPDSLRDLEQGLQPSAASVGDFRDLVHQASTHLQEPGGHEEW